MILITLYFTTPLGASASTISPALAPISARPTGDSLEIFPSKDPIPCCPRSSPFLLHGLPALQWLPSFLHRRGSFSLFAAVNNFRRTDLLFQFLNTSFYERLLVFASSYSEFSERSPIAMASFRRCATSPRVFVRSSSNSFCNFQDLLLLQVYAAILPCQLLLFL